MLNYKVEIIPKEKGKEWFLNKHYAKRMPPITFLFGLILDNEIKGVCSFGTPASNAIRSVYSDYNVIELNRLCIDEGLEKNILSWFLSKCLNIIPKPNVVVSYADTSKGHNGYIYQATNWFYTGLSAKVMDYKVKGMEHLHTATIFDMSRGQKNRGKWLKEKFGDDLYFAERDRKHRYFYFIGNKRQKKDMLKKLKFKIEPYPKGDNQRYDASYKVKDKYIENTLF